MYDDDFSDDWRSLFRVRISPKKLIVGTLTFFALYKFTKVLLAMQRRLETLEAILLDRPPRL